MVLSIYMLIPLILFAIYVMLYLQKLVSRKKSKKIAGKHVVVTGGSSGIGKCAAFLAVQKGANVTIMARNLERLTAAREEIRRARINEDQIIKAVAVDVSNRQAIDRELNKVEEEVGAIYMLINCAGFATCGKVEEFSDENIQSLFNTNYLGTLYPIQNVIPKFKRRKEGIIVITGSQVSLMGMFGYSIYSSCKFALRGLAESINMELKPYNVSVTLSLPPDTDTPGFENENKTKPKETVLISQSGNLFQPEAVAKQLLHDALIGKFFSHVGWEGYLLTTLCVGLSPYTSFFELCTQMLLMGPFRFIAAIYSHVFEGIIQKCHLEDAKDK